MPRVYKQLLRDEKLWVALLEDKDGGESISGRVSRYKALNTELLSALLMPTSTVPAACSPGRCGGTAALSLASASNSIHVTVAVSGLASKAFDVETFVIRLESLETGSQTSRQIEEIVTVQKPQEVSVSPFLHFLFNFFSNFCYLGATDAICSGHLGKTPHAPTVSRVGC